MITMDDINTVVQAAMLKGTYHSTRTEGKLNGFKPIVGQIAIFEDGFLGTVIKAPNSAGDYLVQLPNGERMKENLCTGAVKGFIDQ